MKKTFGKDEKPFPFPLLSDAGLRTFKAYRAYDDFEKMPLHGAFLIDGDGYVRWQDIGYQPFKDTAYLLGEAKRLLRIPVQPAPTRAITSRPLTEPGAGATVTIK